MRRVKGHVHGDSLALTAFVERNGKAATCRAAVRKSPIQGDECCQLPMTCGSFGVNHGE